MMITSKTQIIMALLLLLQAATLGAEPNATAANLIFEISNEPSVRYGSIPRNATHQGVLMVKMGRNTPTFSYDEIMSTPTAKTFSDEQQKLMIASKFIESSTLNPEAHQAKMSLYGTSENDVKKLARAVAEASVIKAQDYRADLLKEQKRLQENITGAEEQIPKIEKELKEITIDSNGIEAKFMDANMIKLCENESTKYSLFLNDLDIEIAGWSAKLKEVDRQINEARQRSAALPSTGIASANLEKEKMEIKNVLENLERMQSAFSVELRGFEAKKKATEEVVQRDNRRIDTFRRKERLEPELAVLKNKLKQQTWGLEDINTRINTPPPEAEPLEIYQNKVTIYPIVEAKNK